MEKSTNNSVALRFLHEHLQMSKFVMSWIDFSESHFGSSKELSQFQVLCG